MKTPSGRTSKILIVEDIDWIRLGMKQVLEQYGYSVAEAKNDLEALEIAKHHAFDMILTEDSSPSFDALVECVSKHPVFQQVPIVIVNPDAEAGAREGGTFVVNDYDQIAPFLTDLRGGGETRRPSVSPVC